MCDKSVVFSRWDEGCVGVLGPKNKIWDSSTGECTFTGEALPNPEEFLTWNQKQA